MSERELEKAFRVSSKSPGRQEYLVPPNGRSLLSNGENCLFERVNSQYQRSEVNKIRPKARIFTKTTVGVTKAELKELRQVSKGLRTKVENVSQPDKKDAALERVQELEQAITQKKPDLSTLSEIIFERR
jgi:hypothetical protein